MKTKQGHFLQTYNFRQTHAYVYVYLCDFSIHISKEDQKESTPFYKNAGERVEKKGTLLQHWWGWKLVQPLWKIVWRVLKKLKIELPYDLGIPLLGVYPEEMKTLIQKDTCFPTFIASLFTIFNSNTHQYMYIFVVFVVQLLSCVRFFCDSMDCSPTWLLCLWDFPGKNTGAC